MPSRSHHSRTAFHGQSITVLLKLSIYRVRESPPLFAYFTVRWKCHSTANGSNCRKFRRTCLGRGDGILCSHRKSSASCFQATSYRRSLKIFMRHLMTSNTPCGLASFGSWYAEKLDFL